MIIVPYDQSLNTPQINDYMNAIPDAQKEECLRLYKVLGLWSFVEGGSGLGLFGAFETDTEGEIYFSLVSDNKLLDEHWVWLAKTLKKSFAKVKDLGSYTHASMHCDVTNAKARKFAEWLGFQEALPDGGGIKYEQAL